MEMLESNWKTWASTNNVVSESSDYVTSIARVDYTLPQIIEDDCKIKKRVEDVLTESGFSEQRAAKLDVDDLLK